MRVEQRWEQPEPVLHPQSPAFLQDPLVREALGEELPEDLLLLEPELGSLGAVAGEA